MILCIKIEFDNHVNNKLYKSIHIQITDNIVNTMNYGRPSTPKDVYNINKKIDDLKTTVNKLKTTIDELEITANESNGLSKKITTTCNKKRGVFGKPCLGALFVIMGGTILYLIIRPYPIK